MITLNKELDINFKNSIFIELVKLLTKVSLQKEWLQAIVNLLKQLFLVKEVLLLTYLDYVLVSSEDKEESNINFFLLDDVNSKPFFKENYYLIPLSTEGVLAIDFGIEKLPQNKQDINEVAILLKNALRTRSDLAYNFDSESHINSLTSVEDIITSDSTLKTKLYLIAKELGNLFNVSRCQVLAYPNPHSCEFDINLCSEYISGSFVEALSVIPTYERNWLNELKNGQISILNIRPDEMNECSTNLETLLSIKSILGLPIVFKSKVVGVLVLHQCDYARSWREADINYLRKIAVMLGLLLGNLQKDVSEEVSCDLYQGTKIISPDELIRELSNLQVKANQSKISFTLFLIDIDKLTDINLQWGYIAGNLVISQTARTLQRYYEHCALARYSNDEFVLIMLDVNETLARVEIEKLKERLSHVCVLGVGPVEYNFSSVTFPTHGETISELLGLLEHSMIISKSRGKGSTCLSDEILSQSVEKRQQLLTRAIPEVFLKKTSLKTGPEIIENLRKQVEEQEKLNIYNPDILESIQSLAIALDAKDSYTEGHSKRVAEYAYILARKINLDLKEQEWVRLAGAMHDIGKIGIPENILCKPGALTRQEFEIMQKHPIIGARILKPINQLEEVAKLVLYHHESWDGTGYPHGLSNEEIPIGSRIVSIVDAYQAMTSDRPYRARLPQEEAIRRLRAGKEKQWDPDLVEQFIEIVTV